MSSPPAIVVDVGNTRIKWGLCSATAVVASAALAPDDPLAWQRQLDAWHLSPPLTWAVSGVQPRWRDRLAEWIHQRGDRVRMLTSATDVPLHVALEQPDRVGIDRLLNAVAANARRRPDAAAIVVDAGSAVTVDLVDATGTFRGGAILPGPRLMAEALHSHTALLPLVQVQGPPPALGTSTTAAMQAGLFHTLTGGIARLIALLTPPGAAVDVFFGGGDAELLAPHLGVPATLWPLMTLEGVRLAAGELS
jgi:type III pantothenate kinase